MKKGVPVSPGIAIARAYRLDEALTCLSDDALDEASLAAEVSKFDAACDRAAHDLDTVIDRVTREVGPEEASIFRAHRLLLKDPSFVGKVRSLIGNKRMNACRALQQTLDEYAALFSRIPDDYLRERLSDIRDVVGRVALQIGMQERPTAPAPSEPVVLVVPEILPSQAVMFERVPVAGILTEVGGSTGHAAILARAMGIPAISGLSDLLNEVKSGDLVVLDGREGHLIVNPGPEAEAAYRKLQREYVDLRDRLVENRDQPAITLDGVSIELLANVNNLPDAATAHRVGATGVGLYRTEYLFLTHSSVPTEEEQFAHYRAVIEASPGRSVTIRTLDLGGDKQVPYFGTSRETNPFMGWRSVRLSATYPEFFQTQLRAILRAARLGQVALLFPMISTVEEVRALKKMLEKARETLVARGEPLAVSLPLGVMIEVPAAAVCVDLLLDEVDFVSIGSNDLIQYVMAADRDNPKVAHLCEPFSPAIFRLLHQVITACVERNKPVTLCGEMAARPRCVLALIGLGLRKLSMSPAFVPTIKELIRSLTLTAAQQSAEAIMKLRTTAEVRNALTRRVRQINPDIALLDTQK